MQGRFAGLGRVLLGTLAFAAAAQAGGEPSKAEIKAGYTAAVTWLVKHQSADGKWDADGWASEKPNEGDEFGDSRFDVGLTALATLALLETEQPGKPVGSGIKRALAWLVEQQSPDGSIGFDPSQGESIYNHALSTLVLCRALHKKKDVRDAAQRALDFCLKAQNPGLGWKYGIKSGRNDSSVTSWMLLCFEAAKKAKLEGDFAAAFEGGASWLARATDSRGDVGYESPGGGSAFLPQNDGKFDPLPVMTAAALHALGGEAQAADAMAKVLNEDLPTWKGGTKKVNFYYWYHGTRGLKARGGQDWKVWKSSVLKALLGNQIGEGDHRGSWPPVAEWCLAGGRVYGTAINALTLSACR